MRIFVILIAILPTILLSSLFASDIDLSNDYLPILTEPEYFIAEDFQEFPKPALDPAELDSFILDQMHLYYIPGVSACAIKDDQIFWEGQYGQADMEDQILVTNSTTFMLCSVSKTVVAVALMQLWEDGLFNLDDNVELYLPFEINNPMCPNEVITFRMLMTHRSSINDNWDILYPLTVPGDSPVPLGLFLEEYLTPNGVYYTAGNFNNWCPGSDVDYSNVGIALAAYLVELLNPYGFSFDEYCDLNIFAPLEMDDTSWFLSGVNYDNIAIPYMYYDDIYHRWPHYGNPVYPAGFLRSNPTHLARHLMAFMQYGILDGVRILDSTTVELMTTIQFAPYGLVWHRQYSGGRLLWGHNGSSWGAGTKMFYCPDENTAVIVLTNRDANDGTRNIMNAIFDYTSIYTGVDDIEIVPTNVSISQNHPNPFNASTTIKYSLTSASEVTIEIYDILGRKIKTIIETQKPAGEHQIVWDAKDHTSGVYLYRIQAGNYSETKKMVLLR